MYLQKILDTLIVIVFNLISIFISNYVNYLCSTAPMNIRIPLRNIRDVSFVVQWDAVINQSVDRYIVSVYWTDRHNPIQSVTVDQTSYTVTGLTPNTTYTVAVASVNESDCTGVASARKEVTTDVSVSVDVTSTVDISRPPSINPTHTTYKSVTNNATMNSGTKLVPTLDVTVMSITTLIPTVIANSPVSTTGMFVAIRVAMLIIHT